MLFSIITTLLKRAGCAVLNAHPVFIYYVVWMPAPVVTSPQVAQVQVKVWTANQPAGLWFDRLTILSEVEGSRRIELFF